MSAKEDLLILTKTYPLPSSNYREHTCVASINKNGEFRRLFPIPFRLLDESKQFSRYQWISANIEKASDKRPESYRIDVDTIQKLTSKPIPWEDRLSIIRPHIMDSLTELETKRIDYSSSIGIVKPIDFSLEIEEEENKDWTPREITNLTQQGLFDSLSVKQRPILQKVPYHFYYRFKCQEIDTPKEFRHMITDWEVGMLYFNCVKLYKGDWEEKLREKLETEFQFKRELYLLMGTMHRFPDQWLIIGLIYPPLSTTKQDALFPLLPDFQ